jgi:hypothetical protein
MLGILKTKKAQELFGLAVVLGATALLGVDIGRKLGRKNPAKKKKKEEQ